MFLCCHLEEMTSLAVAEPPTRCQSPRWDRDGDPEHEVDEVLVLSSLGAVSKHVGTMLRRSFCARVDAQRGTWLIKELLFKEEMARWFQSYETITGSIAIAVLIIRRHAHLGRLPGRACVHAAPSSMLCLM